MTWTKDQVEKMPSDQYKVLFNSNPDFRAAVDSFDSQPVARTAVPTGTATARGREQLHARQAEDPNFGKSFDPSFDEEPVAPVVEEAVAFTPTPAAAEVAPVVAPVAPVVETPAELPELMHRYQPTDEAGRPVGGEQVFKYRTPEELIEKLTKAHSHATVAIRGARAKALISEPANEEGTQFPQYTEFATLSAAEKAEAEQDAMDPDKAPLARARLAESARNEALNRNQENLIQVQTKLAFSEFKADNPDYLRCNENAQAIIGYISSKNWDPTDKANIQRAYDILRNNGALFGKPAEANQPEAVLAPPVPTVREEKTAPNPQVPAQPQARISPEVTPQVKRPVAAPIPTGLSNIDSSSDGEPSSAQIANQLTYRKVYKDSAGKPTGVVETLVGKAAIDAMPAEQYKKLIEEDRRQERLTGIGTGFARTVELIEEDWAKQQQNLRRRR
jgi:hypothetical protein